MVIFNHPLRSPPKEHGSGVFLSIKNLPKNDDRYSENDLSFKAKLRSHRKNPNPMIDTDANHQTPLCLSYKAHLLKQNQ
jgi:hypothetical protein